MIVSAKPFLPACYSTSRRESRRHASPVFISQSAATHGAPGGYYAPEARHTRRTSHGVPRSLHKRLVCGAAGIGAQVEAPEGLINWEIKVYTHGPVGAKDVGLGLTVFSLEGVERKVTLLQPIRDPEPYDRFDRSGQEGRKDSYEIELPIGFDVAAIKINNRGDKGAAIFQQGGEFDRLYFKRVEFSTSSGAELHILANSYISVSQDDRLFVRNDAWTNPKLRTNPTIKKLQEEELQFMRGEGINSKEADEQPRKPGDRIYRYQTYNDLGMPGQARPTLGGSSAYPYPRRLATNRPTDTGGNGFEQPPTTSGFLEQLLLIVKQIPGLRRLVPIAQRSVPSPWVPEDDNFDFDKSVGFLGNAVLGVLPSVLTQLDSSLDSSSTFLRRTLGRLLQLLGAPGTSFDSYNEVLSLYNKAQISELARRDDVPSELIPQNGRADFGARIDALADVGRFDSRTGERAADDSKTPPGHDQGNLLKYDVPQSIADRLDTWNTDREFGRMFLAGHNPVVLEAVADEQALQRLLPRKGDQHTRIDDAALIDLLEGKNFAALAQEAAGGAQPRLFVVDYSIVTALLASLPGFKLDPSRVQHAGRAVLFRGSDHHLVPVAIELTDHLSNQWTVYTGNDPEPLWQLAKVIFLSVDSGYHQLISHFLRTHATAEPFLIALRRQLSPTHPIFRLMMPHFRYTLPINAAARALLTNAGGVIESNFSPGPYCMALSSKVYGLTWRFAEQGLVADLKKRGFLNDDEELRVADYPFASDGRLIWDALHKYFTAYVKLYYTDDAAVKADTHLTAWWKDLRENGHPDIKDGWIELTGIDSLVEICATIAWVASAHHAAVNFGQYAYSGWMPSHSSLCRKPAPMRNDAEWRALENLDPDSAEFQRRLLEWLAPPSSTTKVMTTVKLLSAHAEGEQYIGDEQEWLPLKEDDKLDSIFKQFQKDVDDIEKIIAQYNGDDYLVQHPEQVARNRAAGGLEYTLLSPKSQDAGVTGRGVPYSISI